jgi:dTDP-4-amino-4,6-dideoxygalactose transaminase
MNIPFGDLKRNYFQLKKEIDQAVQRVLDSGWFILGKELLAFEEQFAAFLEVRHAIGVGSGTEALHLALLACDVEPGDEVITVPNTAVPTISAISFANAKPVFVDIDQKTYCMDASLIEEKISNRTKVILPVHLYGRPCDMEAIRHVAEKYNLDVVEDCAQSHGATFNGKLTGTFGRFGCFSFYPSKNLGAYGDAGIVVTNDQKDASKIKLLRNYGEKQRYDHQSKGFNSRLDEMQAAILSVKLAYLAQWNARRREIAGMYGKGIDNPLIAKPQADSRAVHAFHLYVIRCPHRDHLREYLRQNGVGTQIHYPIPCHLQQAYKDLGLKKGSYPVTERYASEILSLPIYPELADEEIGYIVGKINQYRFDG